MKTIHAKSPCCGARVYAHGLRRRQCSRCGRTWRIRKKRRGRPRRRIRLDLLDRVFLANHTLRMLLRRTALTPQAISQRFRNALRQFLAQPRPNEYPTGNLVLLVDGLWFRFRGRPCVLYLMALKPCTENSAVFLDPLLFWGRESAQLWRQVLQAIPPEPKRRIRALVSDNVRGMKSLARHNGWVFQLCHFHLISQLQGRRGRKKTTLAGRTIREQLYQLTRQALELPDGPRLQGTLRRLRSTVSKPLSARKMRMAVRQFLRDIHHYRAYRIYPELGLPATTNTVEAMGHIIRDLLRRTRHLRSQDSLLFWTTAFIRKRPALVCNGKHFPPN